MKKIFAAIICYNHSKTLELVFKKIDKKFYSKIIIFDDKSTDNTLEVAKKMGCEVLENYKNLGHGGNLKKALNHCFNEGADYVVEIHGDDQYDPNLIINNFEKIKNQNDLIIGSRFVNKNPYKSDGMPYLRYITNLIFSKVTSSLLDIKLTEFHTGYKIFSKKFHEQVPYESNSNSYLFSFQVILQTKFNNLSIDEISISSKYHKNSTSCNYLNGLIYLIGNIKYVILFFLANKGFNFSKVFKKKQNLNFVDSI